jgi:hypothetical protein
MSCRHEWTGAVIKGPVNRIVIDQCENCGELRLPDTAPPAQGIDLGQVREIRIPARNNLDPISVFIQDQAAGRGRIVVTCYGNAWQAFWGAMGDRTVMEFVAQCDADYVAGNMISGRQTRMTKAERAYTERIATEVIAEFRSLRDGQRDAAPGPRISQGTHDPSGVANG